jgi:hypothetical protein
VPRQIDASLLIPRCRARPSVVARSPVPCAPALDPAGGGEGRKAH